MSGNEGQGGGGGSNLGSWRGAMPGQGNMAAAAQMNQGNLPATSGSNPAGAGFNPGPANSPAYIQPQTQAHGPGGNPPQWGPGSR
ncbi:hypothetical protein PG989_003948 [Apiospora arundinis]